METAPAHASDCPDEDVEDSTQAYFGPHHYHYRPGELLVGEEDLDRVHEGLRDSRIGFEPKDSLEELGVHLLDLRHPDETVPSVLSRLHGRWGRSVQVAPNHVLRPLSHTMITLFPPRACPGTRLDMPVRKPGPNERAVTVGVLDSGYDPENPYLRSRCQGDEEKAPNGHEVLPASAGHGTLVAGVVLQEAPAASVEMRQVIDGCGHVDDFTLAKAVRGLARLAHVRVLNFSVGTYTYADRGALAIERALRHVRFTRPDIVMVAGAGNDATARPMFPAASKSVIGVGAVEQVGGRWRRTCFSNHGWWVDACAPGVDLLSTFFKWEGQVAEPERVPKRCADWIATAELPGRRKQHFQYTAVWTGTSAAAPVVAGRIADLLHTSEPQDAVRAVLADPAMPRIPGVGVLVQPEHVHIGC
jgi:subtilisin family serine protease